MSTAKTKKHQPVDPAICNHPASRLYAWFARDDREPSGEILCVACCDCSAVLQGGATLEDDEPAAGESVTSANSKSNGESNGK